MTGRRPLSAVGKQNLSTRKSEPQHSFGTGPSRGHSLNSNTNVGPGTYQLKASMSEQTISSKASAPAFQFPRSSRSGSDASNPTGPGEYPIKGTIGPQFTRKSDPSFSFGSSSRNGAGGGSEAVVPMAAVSSIGTQVERKTAPAASISGRTKFGSTVREVVGPGPAAYRCNSSMGRQASSTRRSAPGGGFGMERKGTIKGVRSRADTPGPGSYVLPSSIGRSASSTRKSGPAFSMRAREKFGGTETSGSSRLPGPGAYKPRLVNPNERTAPQVTMASKHTVIFDSRPSTTPGPGAYTQKSGLGDQPLSRHLSQPRACFQRERRMADKQRGVEMGGSSGAYNVAGAVGPQPESTRKNLPKYSFGSAARMNLKPTKAKAKAGKNAWAWDEEGGVPGPGSYAVRGSMGSQVSSSKGSAAAASMAGREKFGDPYGGVKAASAGGQFATPSSMGQQHASTRTSDPAFSFSLGARGAQRARNNVQPGPGAYMLVGAVGQQPESVRRNAPMASMHGRETFGDPYNRDLD